MKEDDPWVVTQAHSSNSDYGPELIAMRLSEETLRAIALAREKLNEVIEKTGGYGRTTLFVGGVEFLDCKEGCPLEDRFAELMTMVGSDASPVILTPEEATVMVTEMNATDSLYGDWRSELEGIVVWDSRVGSGSVRARAEIKHTDIIVESQDLESVVNNLIAKLPK